MKHDLKPREKMQLLGVENLQNSELLATILGFGTKNQNVIELSKKILNTYELEELKNKSIQELCQIKGIKTAQATKIKAALELSNRQTQKINKQIKNSKDVYQACKELIDKKQEHFITLILNSKNQLIKKDLISKGTLNLTIIHPREIFKNAIKESANSIILVHNHPSGDPTPSEADIKVTKQICKAGKLLDIKVLDHVIIGTTHYSFQENNQIS